MTSPQQREAAIGTAILAAMKTYGANRFDVVNQPEVARLQWGRPRCWTGCTCEMSEAWRLDAEKTLRELGLLS